MTLQQALMLDLIFCKNCGYRPNNHFDFGERVCAHTKCTGYKEAIYLPEPKEEK